MISIKQQKMEGRQLFKKLYGAGPSSTIAFRGGLFESKISCVNRTWESSLLLESRCLERIGKTVSSLPENEANNIEALSLFIQTEIKYGVRTQYLKAWLSCPNVKLNTKNKVFAGMVNSFKDVKRAARAYGVYQMFLSPSVYADNPWTVELAQNPGYLIFPYFEAAGVLQGIMPKHTKDQYAYREIVSKIKEQEKDCIAKFPYDKDYYLPLVLIDRCPPEQFQDILSKYQSPKKVVSRKHTRRLNIGFSKIKE